ncbi:hypothetical protein Tco_0419051 [Tanacetum coccineum]
MRFVGDDSARSEPTEVADSNNFKPLLKEKRLKEQTTQPGKAFVKRVDHTRYQSEHKTGVKSATTLLMEKKARIVEQRRKAEVSELGTEFVQGAVSLDSVLQVDSENAELRTRANVACEILVERDTKSKNKTSRIALGKEESVALRVAVHVAP